MGRDMYHGRRSMALPYQDRIDRSRCDRAENIKAMRDILMISDMGIAFVIVIRAACACCQGYPCSVIGHFGDRRAVTVKGFAKVVD